MYTSFIRPILEFACLVWSNCYQAQKNEIEKVQVSALRIITDTIKGTSSVKIYKESKMQSTFDRREIIYLTIFYRCFNLQRTPISNTLK